MIRNWLTYFVALVIAVAALMAESSLEMAPGHLDVRIGGPVSQTALVAGGLLLAYVGISAYRARLAERRFQGRSPESKIVFCQLSDEGIAYGVRGIWSKFYAWRLISRIEMKRSSVSFAFGDGSTTDLNAALFTLEQIEALRSFFAETREVVAPEPFFGWRGKRKAGQEIYGAMSGRLTA